MSESLFNRFREQGLPRLDAREFLEAFQEAQKSVVQDGGAFPSPAEARFLMHGTDHDLNGISLADDLEVRDTPVNRLGLAILRRFSGQAEKALAFLYRYFALLEVADEPRLARWQRKAEDGSTQINEVLMLAAAEAPTNSDLEFDRDSYVALVERLWSERN